MDDTRLIEICGFTGFVNVDKLRELILVTNRNLVSKTTRLSFCGDEYGYEPDKVYSEANIEEFKEDFNKLVKIKNYSRFAIYLIRGASQEEAIYFLKMLFITKILIETKTNIDQTTVYNNERFYSNLKETVIKVSKARMELQRLLAASDEKSEVPSGFRNIYQSQTIDEDLSIFDQFYTFDENEIMFKEKMEIGLKLMEKGNAWRKDSKGTSQTLVLSTGKKIAVYFPRADDYIEKERYSYPRAAIHTARELATVMQEKKMVSALGLSIGWNGLLVENNFTIFMNKLNVNEEQLNGITKLKRNPSVMYLVSIPRVRPHKYLNLTNAEALIFLIFNMINDAMLVLKANSNAIKGNFCADVLTKLNNSGIKLNPELFNNAIIIHAIAFAAKMCILYVKKKDGLPTEYAKTIKRLIKLCKHETERINGIIKLEERREA